MDYFIKAESKDALWQALEAAGMAHKDYDWDDPANVRPADLASDEEWKPTGKYVWLFDAWKGYDIDLIGTIFKPTGEMLQGEDGPYPEMAALDGYHANIRSHADQLPKAVVDALAPVLIVAPNNPVRVFA